MLFINRLTYGFFFYLFLFIFFCQFIYCNCFYILFKLPLESMTPGLDFFYPITFFTLIFFSRALAMHEQHI